MFEEAVLKIAEVDVVVGCQGDDGDASRQSLWEGAMLKSMHSGPSWT